MASIFRQDDKKHLKKSKSFVAISVTLAMCLGVVGFCLVEQEVISDGTAHATQAKRTAVKEASKANADSVSASKASVDMDKFSGKIKPLTVKMKPVKSKKKRAAKKASATLKATWYTGDVLGFRGSGGKLTHAKSVALNAAQRQALGLAYGQEVYLEFPGGHDGLSGWYEIKDSGCANGVVDMFYKSKGSVPSKFKSAGVVRSVKLFKARKKTMKAKATALN
ncbi:MAG: hypothetical protein LBG50_02840 [Clostridiales Family XIII bacterium]|jgi:hypothetical protein|nr:hypothetical protein [Clostridiales Family XIII bacterium]